MKTQLTYAHAWSGGVVTHNTRGRKTVHRFVEEQKPEPAWKTILRRMRRVVARPVRPVRVTPLGTAVLPPSFNL